MLTSRTFSQDEDLSENINHFPSMYQIWRKNLLAKNLKRMERTFGNDFRFSPPTWVLPHDLFELKNYIEKK